MVAQTNVWRNTQFTKFFAAYTIGNIGDWFDIFALQLIAVHEWHVTPVLMGVLWLFFFIPSIILGPISGVIADRLSKRDLMLYTDFAAGVLTVGLYLSGSITQALVLVFIRSSVQAFNAPAQQAYIKHVVTDEQLLKASSLTTIVFQGCKVMGPMFGAVVLIFTTARFCLLINAFSFFISTVLLLLVLRDKAERKSQDDLHWAQDMLTGSKIIWQNRLLRVLVMFITAWYFCSLVRQAQFAIYLKQVLPMNKHALGFFMGVDGLGAVVSGMLLSRKQRLNNYHFYCFFGFLLIGIGNYGISIFQNTWPQLILYMFGLAIGMGTGILLVIYGYVTKKVTTKSQMGRVSSTGSMFGSIALAIGTVSSGFLVGYLGVHELYLFLAVIMAVLSVSALILLKVYHK